jgi:hypothetical protein
VLEAGYPSISHRDRVLPIVRKGEASHAMFTSSVEGDYDFIVVGSGAGGAPVAVNLAKSGYRVLVLEAPGADEPDEYKVPAFHSLSTEHSQLAWKFYVQHYADKDLQGRDCRAGDAIRSRRRRKDCDTCEIVRGAPTLGRGARQHPFMNAFDLLSCHSGEFCIDPPRQYRIDLDIGPSPMRSPSSAPSARCRPYSLRRLRHRTRRKWTSSIQY